MKIHGDPSHRRPQVPRYHPSRGFPAPPELEETPPKWIQLAGFLPIGEGHYLSISISIYIYIVHILYIITSYKINCFLGLSLVEFGDVRDLPNRF